MAERLEFLETLAPYEGWLGRSVIEHDPLSFGFRAVTGDEPIERQLWWRRGVFDQGRTSSCVGQGTVGILQTSPSRFWREDRFRQVDPYQLYALAQREHDPWPGQEPEYYGTSTNAGMKAARALGLIPAWSWCFGLNDVLRCLSVRGPVGIGVSWTEAMFHPDADGYLDDSGEVAGGHFVELLYVDPSDQEVGGVNSWGLDWGNNGRFKMRWEVLERRLADRGEAVAL